MSAIAVENQVELFEIGTEMRHASLPDAFVAQAVLTAAKFDGVYDLCVLWRDESDKSERDEIIADIQELIDDCTQTEQKEAAYIRFDDLESIGKDVRKFKDGLLMVVNQQGGITRLAGLTGMPQPSLSRFFNTSSMPRRGTLLKIAKALDLGAVQIATEWVRE
jgi:DNA-binding phage protein